jgi:hypothetical protein
LLQLLSGGFIDKWTDDRLKMARIRGMFNAEKDASDDGSTSQRAMSLNDLQGAFIILGIGLFISFVAWVVEQARLKRDRSKA